MNYLLIPTVLFAGLLFVLGAWLGRRNPDRARFYSMCGLGLILATPGAGFAAYYLKVFGDLNAGRNVDVCCTPSNNSPIST